MLRDPLFRKALRDLRVQVLGWGIGMGAMLAITVALFPSIADLYGDFFKDLPDAWKGFLGEGDFTKMEGFLDVEFFSYAQVAFAVFAILAGGAAIVGEETAGTMDLLLSQPVTRARLATAKLAALVVAVTLIVAISSLGLVLPDLVINEVSEAGRVLNAFVLLLPFELTIAFAAALLAQLFGSRLVGGTILAGLLVASYMLEALSGVSALLQDLKPLYLTTYFQGRAALTGDISWAYLGASLIALALLSAANVLYFMRRDVAVGNAVSLRLPWRRRAAQPSPPAGVSG